MKITSRCGIAAAALHGVAAQVIDDYDDPIVVDPPPHRHSPPRRRGHEFEMDQRDSRYRVASSRKSWDGCVQRPFIPDGRNVVG